MPRRAQDRLCPVCAKSFKTEANVLQHLNQPWGRCAALKADLTARVTSKHLAPHSTVNDHGPMEEDLFNDPGVDYAQDPVPASDANVKHREYFPVTSQVHGNLPTFMDLFDDDAHASKRERNLYWPFDMKGDWEVGSWLLRSGLSMRMIDEFLHLEKIKQLGLSYNTAKDLRNRAELLPSGPRWKCKPWKTSHPTKKPLSLFYRDSIECLQSLLRNPLFADSMHYTPFHEFTSAAKLVRVYEEWMSGNNSWRIQSQLPDGATLVGTILSSDKTNISVMTGDRVAHPLLISCANIAAEIRMKSSQNAFMLLALLPVPKFLEKRPKVRGILGDRLIHSCLDFVLEPLKIAAAVGIMMADALGQSRFCFTPLAAYMVDTQEALMLAGVAGKTSHLTTASYRQFGDNFRHPPRTASLTLSQRDIIRASVDPTDIAEYGQEAMAFRLNGVDSLFWRDWPFTDPSVIFTPEPLHHWHKAFWDHDAKWCIRAVGPSEIDFRFTILPRRVGFRHFKEGISKLKQVTGREHRDIERYMVGVIADAVPKDFVIAIRSMMEFRYLSQAPAVDDEDIICIDASLREFHDHKQSILDAGARVGKGNNPINNWHIPKIEMLQSVTTSIRDSGAAHQWSADITEHGHITEVKEPAQNGNNQNYEAQICRSLDRTDKIRRFELATSMRAAGVEFGRYDPCADPPDNLDSDEELDGDFIGPPTRKIDRTSVLLATIQPTTVIAGPKHVQMDYFAHAERLATDNHHRLPFPPRTFVSGQTAFHLGRDPSFKLSLEDASSMYGVPDLRQALAVYLHHVTDPSVNINTLPIGGRRLAVSDSCLSSGDIRIWTNVRIQTKKYHHTHQPAEARTVMASPRCAEWPVGRYDPVIVNNDPNQQWPKSGLEGHSVGQLRLIFHLPNTVTGGGIFLAYVQRFDIVPQLSSGHRAAQPEPTTKMYVLKRALRTDKTRIGDVIPLSRLRSPIYLQPRFGPIADPRLTSQNSLEYSSELWLNHYAEKEHFWALHVRTRV
ncbi:hypothetical protein HWV62_8483 [Athelia sp. TMB]|nr:hypothetical protein HWV62_8483 [Athelia sp. TMB]